MTELKNTDKDVLCILSIDDPSIKKFREEVMKLRKRDNISIEHVEETDHLFGSVDKVHDVINKTYDWIINQETYRRTYEKERVGNKK